LKQHRRRGRAWGGDSTCDVDFESQDDGLSNWRTEGARGAGTVGKNAIDASRKIQDSEGVGLAEEIDGP
jgi:hypothetical protein